MEALKILFWFFLFIIFYAYAGYGLLIWLYIKIAGRYKSKFQQNNSVTFEPEVTVIIATYNEEAIIEKKIQNTFDLNYPPDKLKILIIADGSTDKTVQTIEKHNNIELLYQPGRKGKVAAINRAMPFIKTEYVIFCDANTILNTESIRNIVRHFNDPEIGAVAGEKKVVDNSDGKNTAGSGEGLYWKYESFLKELDSSFYSVVGAAGELFSIRTNLFEPADTNVLLDDFIMSMKICAKGYRVVYEPKAFAMEAPSYNMKEEQKRKIRISAGGFQSVLMLLPLLNIFKYGRLSFQYISHRVLRWIVCPFLLPVLLLLNIVICTRQSDPVFNILLGAQILFYIAALSGWILAQQNKKSKAFYIPYYFLFMNLSLYIGLKRFLNNKQTVLWDKARRTV